MSRRKGSAIERAFSSFTELNFDEQQEFYAMVKGFQHKYGVAPPKPERKPRDKKAPLVEGASV